MYLFSAIHIQSKGIIHFLHDLVARATVIKKLTVSDLSNILIPLSEISRTVHIG